MIVNDGKLLKAYPSSSDLVKLKSSEIFNLPEFKELTKGLTSKQLESLFLEEPEE